MFLFAQHLQNICADSLHRRKFSAPYIAAGEKSLGRSNESIAVLSQLDYIILHDRVVIHSCIHRRSDNLRTGTGHNSRCRHVIGDSRGYLADNICRSRSDDAQICSLRCGNVLHIELEAAVEGVDETFACCQRLKCNRRNEFRSVCSQTHRDGNPGLYQIARNVRRLICRDRAAHDEQYIFLIS